MNINYLIIMLFIIMAPSSYAAVKLSIDDQILITRALGENRSHINMVFVTELGASQYLKRNFSNNNITIEFSDEYLGYFRARVPIKKIVDVLSWKGVEALNIPVTQPYLSEVTHGNSSPQRKNDDGKLDLNRYLQKAESNKNYDWREPMGIRTFWESNPNFDGRGTAIAIIERFPDANRIELRSAKNINGDNIDKIIDIIGIYNKSEEDMEIPYYDSGALVKLDAIKSKNGILDISAKEKIIVNDDDDEYLVGRIREDNQLYEYLRSGHRGNMSMFYNNKHIYIVKKKGDPCFKIDFNINSNMKDEKCVYPKLKKRNNGRVLKNNSLNYSDVLIIPTENPNKIIVTKPLDHTHRVSAIAAGANFWGSFIGGVAPGARLLSIGVGGREDEIIEAMILAAHDRRIDIILSMLSSASVVNGDKSVFSIVANRIAENYNKVIISPAGNGAKILNAVVPRSVGSRVISVAQWHEYNMNIILKGQPVGNYTHINSSAGPASDGALKPDIAAASLLISPILPGGAQGAKICPNIMLTADSGCGAGTSWAGPAAAGAVAVLLSAARQTGLKVSEEDIRQALYATAVLNQIDPVHVQGRGVINIPSAFKYLRKILGSNKNWPGVKLEVQAPVDAKFHLYSSGVTWGRGLFEREGFHQGDNKKVNILLTRRGGQPGNEKYNLSIIGDMTDAFSTINEVVLPLGRSVSVPVWINGRKEGVNSAILRIKDSGNELTLADVGLTAVVSIPLVDYERYSKVLTLSKTYFSLPEYYIDVESDLIALNIGEFSKSGVGISYTGPLGNLAQSENYYAGLYNSKTEGEPVHTLNAIEYRPSPGVWSVRLSPLDDLEIQIQEFDVKIVGIPDIIGKFKNKVVDTSCNILGDSQNLDKDLKNYNGVYDVNTEEQSGVLDVGMAVIRLNEMPTVVPISSDNSSRYLEVYGELTGSDVGAGNLVATVISCNDTRCFVADGVVGEKKISIIIDKDRFGRKSDWYLGLSAIGESNDNQKIYFEVFSNDNQREGNVFNDIRYYRRNKKGALGTQAECHWRLPIKSIMYNINGIEKKFYDTVVGENGSYYAEIGSVKIPLLRRYYFK